jgi:outer membrane beta-barrel protein
MTTNKRLMVLAMTVLGVALLGPVHGAQAQEVQVSGPLAGAPAVMKMRLYRKGRLQVMPFAGITLQDEYSRTIFTGGQLAFHITDWLGIGVFGAYGVHSLDTGLTDEVTAKGQTSSSNVLNLPDKDGFENQIGRLNWMAGGQIIFIPLRGKLGLFEKLFVDTDFYVAGGVAAIEVSEREDVNINQVGPCTATRNEACRTPLLDQRGRHAQRTVITPTFAAGLSLYMAEFLALNIEWRALPFSWNTSGTDVASANSAFPDGRIDASDRRFQFNHMISLGLAFYLPTSVDITHTEN